MDIIEHKQKDFPEDFLLRIKSLIIDCRASIKLDFKTATKGRRFYHDERILYMVTGNLIKNPVKDISEKELKKLINQYLIESAETDFYYMNVKFKK